MPPKKKAKVVAQPVDKIPIGTVVMFRTKEERKTRSDKKQHEGVITDVWDPNPLRSYYKYDVQEVSSEEHFLCVQADVETVPGARRQVVRTPILFP